ncbi:NAD(P)H-dependent oxidoreductase [Siculibacillus lacustris]|uniref:NAD(P)H-dependent oxidoreductase n=1 Tax=Siculibacillus lacustris TaxID=1549641 RepID=A0A4Q9VRH1_9HYPH|nr:NAD(P)H-dependent oxidoreductase [Siculibacillus lacustris]TBW38004.1 NAD(P)H-dependent oxidoreductase [Siculibacillus lacustris]
MTTPYDVAVLVGSLRKGSISRTLANALIGLADPRLALRLVEIGDLPLYDPDLDVEGGPAPWARLRREIAPAAGLLFVTPEYNRSVPASLKNAIDVGSRPYGKAVWSGKPGAIISLSQGLLGGFGANHHLRQMLVFLDVPAMQQPEAYLSNAGQLFDAEGGFVSPGTRDFMAAYLAAFASWIERAAKRA